MFLTVTLNAAIDKTLRVANLQIGRRHRCAPGDLQAGGKGINVARALRALGQPVVATGLAGGRAGDMIVEDLTAGGIVHQFVRIADESRSSTIVLDPRHAVHRDRRVRAGRAPTSSRRSHVVLTPGEVRHGLISLLGGSEAVVLAGSLPRDVPEDWYATALREARRQRVYAVLDSEGEPLRLGLGGEPDLIVPNQMEAEELVGFEFETRRISWSRSSRSSRWARAASSSRATTARSRSCASRAGRCSCARRCRSSRSSPRSGAGDALLAGLLAARRAERPFAEALRYAVACGAASTQHEQPGMLDPREVQRLSALVEVAELTPAQA